MNIHNLIKEMTLKEKIAQLTQISFNFKNFEDVKEKIENYQVGSLILGGTAFVGDGDEATVEKNKIKELQKTAVEKTRLGIPLLFGRDVIHGHETIFPVNLAMAASFNPKLLRTCYDKIREEAAYDGINWTFCPMLDFCHDPRWGRIIECQGEDPYLASKLAEAIVKGFQTDSLSNEGSVAACAKHYIGYGASEGGRDYNHTEVSDYSLWNNYIPAFRSAVNSGVATVMNSFNEMNGIPVAASKRLLTDILRGKLGFNGFVISDWNAISQLKNHCMVENDADAAELALKAGIDMDMVDDCYFNHLEELVESGRVSEELINLSVERILNIKDKMGLFEKPVRSFPRPNIEENAKLASKMCAETAVLLKNEGDLLPLNKNQKITVTGPFAGVVGEHSGSWVILTDAYKPQSFIDAIRDYAPETNIQYKDNLSSSYFAARNTDVVICALGEPPYVTGEMHSVSSIEIPEAQKQLLIDLKKQGKKVVGLLFFGRPVALQSVEPYMDAILLMWHGGVSATKTAVQLLFGDSQPSGRLPVTFPRVTGQIPIYYNVLPAGRDVNGYYGDDGKFMRNYEDCSGTPMYPFGYGLSYTKFEYSDITAEKTEMTLKEINDNRKFKLSVEVKNTGSRAGTEVIQLYIHDVAATHVRPLRELKGFKKAAIKSGETIKIDFELGYSELGYYTENGEYIIEPGKFKVFIGENCLTENSVDIRLG